MGDTITVGMPGTRTLLNGLIQLLKINLDEKASLILKKAIAGCNYPETFCSLKHAVEATVGGNFNADTVRDFNTFDSRISFPGVERTAKDFFSTSIQEDVCPADVAFQGRNFSPWQILRIFQSNPHLFFQEGDSIAVFPSNGGKLYIGITPKFCYFTDRLSPSRRYEKVVLFELTQV
ncbi:MAG: hypothetical protein V4439_03930 [Patescibacteria group bacterium]